MASNNPWMIHYLTRRPAVACPYFPPGTDVGTFARQFGVRWVVLFRGKGDARVRHCRGHPGLRLVRGSDRERVYLFAVR